MQERIDRLEEKLAFQDQSIQELTEAVYRQQQEIDALREHNTLLADRLEALKSASDAPTGGEELPPHY